MDRGMRAEIREESTGILDEYARVPIAFRVERVLDVVEIPDEGFALIERRLATPYVKDYDAIDGGPARWGERFDLSGWGIVTARVDGRLVGAAAVAPARPELAGDVPVAADEMILWDIRVAPEVRGAGIGAGLFRGAAAWARARGARSLIVETQNVNLPACRLYQAMGCELIDVTVDAYPGLPGETRMIWRMTCTDAE